MSPPPAATVAPRIATPRRRAQSRRLPRRISGPAPRTATLPNVAVGNAGAALRALPDLRILDRLIRGRGWIFVIGVGLLGIVAMQVSMLKLNAGVGTAVERATVLERQNATLRAQVSQLSSAERIESAAQKIGMTMPPAGSVSYLDPGRRADVRLATLALASGRARPRPDFVAAAGGPLANTQLTPVVQTGVVGAAGGVAPTPPSTTAATQPVATTPVTAVPVAQQAPTTQVVPSGGAAQQAPAPVATPPTAPVNSGGVSAPATQ